MKCLRHAAARCGVCLADPPVEIWGRYGGDVGEM